MTITYRVPFRRRRGRLVRCRRRRWLRVAGCRAGFGGEGGHAVVDGRTALVVSSAGVSGPNAGDFCWWCRTDASAQRVAGVVVHGL